MIASPFGLIALIPAMLNLTVVTGGQTIAVQICTGDGQIHTVQMPLSGEGKGDPASKALCCAKGCHSGGQRKRVASRN
jgi:hypothetical protein